MKNLLLAGALAIAFGSTPAHAVLQIAAQIGPDSFFCADNTPCDQNPATNLVTTASTVLDGIVFSPASASSASGSFDFLNASSLLITNTTGAAVNVTITTGNVGFASPINAVSTAGSGVWQGPGGSFASLNWFVDPADAQGANNAFDTPGVLVNNDFTTSIAPLLSFNQNRSGIALSLAAPYSMTEQITMHLAPGESLVNRGQAIVGAAIPEPSTWAMLIVGFVSLAWAGLRRGKKDRLLTLR